MPSGQQQKGMQRRRSFANHNYLKGKEVSPCAKYVLFLLNLLLWLSGGLAIGIGAYALVLQKVTFDVTSLILNPGVWFIAIGATMFFIGFFGSVGALRENKCMLKTYGYLVLVIVILEVGVGLAAFLLQDEFIKRTKSVMLDAIKQYHTTNMQTDLDDTVEGVQMNLKCCGADTPRDWLKNNRYFNCTEELFSDLISSCGVPPSCCRTNSQTDSQCGYKVFAYPEMPVAEQAKWPSIFNRSEIIYEEGCGDAALKWVKDNYVLVGGIAFGLLFLEVVVILMACHLVDQINFLLDLA
ncbi:tetraspanin-33-like [Sycon ciliatum]|uniref:tetraspanin-33-like n=1 Tax=Sycon ciliatum TaxID=27933 RepID=UPI0031F6CEAC